jgi:hypothetical protein
MPDQLLELAMLVAACIAVYAAIWIGARPRGKHQDRSG